jgi:DNA-binding transcriptional MocR family regulator
MCRHLHPTDATRPPAGRDDYRAGGAGPQPVHQVRQSLLLGCLQEGGRLPTVRDVAASLVINPNTIVKAYRQLEHGARPTIGRGRECRQARRLSGDVQDCAWQPLVLARLRVTLNQA